MADVVLAVKQGDVAALCTAIARAPKAVNDRDNNACTPLIHAAAAPNPQVKH